MLSLTNQITQLPIQSHFLRPAFKEPSALLRAQITHSLSAFVSSSTLCILAQGKIHTETHEGHMDSDHGYVIHLFGTAGAWNPPLSLQKVTIDF